MMPVGHGGVCTLRTGLARMAADEPGSLVAKFCATNASASACAATRVECSPQFRH